MRCKEHCLKRLILGLAAVVLFAWAGVAAGDSVVSYDVAIRGVEDKSLREILESVSNTVTFKNKPPATLSLLQRRARTDIPDMLQAMRSEGYYNAKLELTIDEKTEPPLVVFNVSPGPLYRIESIDIERAKSAEPESPVKLPTAGDIGLELNEPAKADYIIDARNKLVLLLQKLGFPFARVDERVVVDHATKLVSVTFPVMPGPMAHFGPTTFSGLESVEKRFVQGLLPWKEGDRFNSNLLEEVQKKLAQTRLFSLVEVKHAQGLDEAGRLPIVIQLKERAKRSMSGGVTYQTDQGPGATAAWENRNLLRGGETLKLQAGASGFGYSGEGLFKKPQFLRNDQLLAIDSRLANDDTNAFTSQNFNTSLSVERELAKGMRFGLGPAFRVSRVKMEADPLGRKESFDLASFAGYFNWDTSDNLLNPAKGWRLGVTLSPYMDVVDGNSAFVRGHTSYSRYFKISDNLILAGRTALGTIIGTSRDLVPGDLRFYGGGGGSIRGYAFQYASPLVNNEPVGGRSIFELSAELRAKITEKIGFVTFVDGGSAFEGSYPDFKEPLHWGGGVGVRYFTPLGPLRLDFAVPFNPRSVDDPFQIYVSIGQAF